MRGTTGAGCGPSAGATLEFDQWPRRPGRLPKWAPRPLPYAPPESARHPHAQASLGARARRPIRQCREPRRVGRGGGHGARSPGRNRFHWQDALTTPLGASPCDSLAKRSAASAPRSLCLLLLPGAVVFDPPQAADSCADLAFVFGDRRKCPPLRTSLYPLPLRPPAPPPLRSADPALHGGRSCGWRCRSPKW